MCTPKMQWLFRAGTYVGSCYPRLKDWEYSFPTILSCIFPPVFSVYPKQTCAEVLFGTLVLLLLPHGMSPYLGV